MFGLMLINNNKTQQTKINNQNTELTACKDDNIILSRELEKFKNKNQRKINIAKCQKLLTDMLKSKKNLTLENFHELVTEMDKSAILIEEDLNLTLSEFEQIKNKALKNKISECQEIINNLSDPKKWRANKGSITQIGVEIYKWRDYGLTWEILGVTEKQLKEIEKNSFITKEE